LRLPGDHATPYLENTMPLEYNGDPTMMGMGSNNHSWGALDMDLQFPTFNSLNSADFAFDTTAFAHQNEQSLHPSSTSTDSGFNLQFPTFNSPNFSFDTPSTFDFEKFSHPPSNLTEFTSIVPDNNTSFAFSSPPIIAPNPAASVDASSFAQFQLTAALDSTLPQTAVSPRSIVSSPPIIAPNPALRHAGISFSMVAPASVDASSFAQFQPTAALDSTLPQTAVSPHLDSVNNSAPLRTVSPHLDSVNLNTCQPTVVPGHGDASQHIPAPSYASSQQVAVPSDAPSPLPVQNDAPSQHAETSESAPSSLAVSEVTSSVPLNQADAAPDSRRSGRNPVPSKRQEQMNQIDGKAKKKMYTASAHVEKENTPSVTPEWATASHDLLLKSDLGKDWKTCVQTWFELEQELGFGSQAGAKVDLLQ
jgi:hypothetical protein